MANQKKEIVTGYIITGDAKGAIKAAKLTDKELSALNKTTNSAIQYAKDHGKALRDGVNQLGKWGAAASGAALAAGAALVKKNLEQIDTLAKTSDALGVTTEALGGLRYASNLTGLSNAELDKSLEKLTVNVGKAARGTGTAKEAIEQLGLSAEALARMSPDKQFETVAEALSKVESKSLKASLSYDIFGRKGTALINTLDLGSSGLREMAAEADSLGITLSRVDAAKIEQANDAWSRGSGLLSSFGKQLTIAVAPVMTKVVEDFTAAGKNAGGFGEVATEAFDFALKAVGLFADGLHGLNLIWEGLKVAAFGYATYAISMADKIAQGFSTALSWIPGIDIDYESSTLREFTIKMQEDFRESTDNLQAMALEEIPSRSIEKYVAEARDAAQAAAVKVGETKTQVIEAVTTASLESAKKVKKLKDEADPFATAWEEATKRIDDSFAGAWEGAFDSFSDFSNRLLDGFKRLLAELAHQSLTKPILVNLGLSSSGGPNLGTIAGGGSSGGGLLSSVSNLWGAVSSGGGLFGSLASGFGAGGVAGAIDGAAGYAMSSYINGGAYIGNAAPASYQMANQGLISESATTTVNSVGNAVTSAAITAAAAYIGAEVGDAVGEAIFDKQAESNWGAVSGGVIGGYVAAGTSIGGPWGAAIGALIGALVDVAGGGDGNERYRLGVATGLDATSSRYAKNSTQLESGLLLTEITSRVGREGNEAAASMTEAFKAIDSHLVQLAENLGQAVDLTDVTLRGKTWDAGHEGEGGSFFGSAFYNGVSESQMEAAAGAFWFAWGDAVGGQVNQVMDQITAGMDVADVSSNIDVLIKSLQLMTGPTTEFSQLLNDLASSYRGVDEDGRANIATLLELAGNLVSVNSVLEDLSVGAFGFNQLGVDSAKALSDMYGGIEGLGQAAGVYLQTFTTAEERFKNFNSNIASSFSEMDLALPTTRQGFKDLVEGLDLTSEAAREQFANLMTLVPAMDQFYGGLDSTRETLTRLYNDVLGREPETEGLEYWVDQVVKSGLTIDQVAHAIENSNEAVSNHVRDLYADVLGRAPETEGLEYWVNEIQTGAMTFEQVAESFANSQEAIYNSLTEGAAEFAEALAGQNVIESMTERERAEKQLNDWYAVQIDTLNGYIDAGYQFAGGSDSVLGNIQDIFDRGMADIEDRFAVAVVEVVDTAAEALRQIQADADGFATGLADRNFREGLSPQALAEYELQQWYDGQLALVNDFLEAGAEFAGGTESVLTNIDEIFDRGLASIEERFAEAVVEVVDTTAEALKLIQADADSFAARLADRNFREGLSPRALAEFELQEWYDGQLALVNDFLEAGAEFAGGAESVLANIDDIFDRGLSSIEERFTEAVVEVVDTTAEALKLIQADADGFAAGLADRNFREGLSPRALAEFELQEWYDGQLALVNDFLEAGAEFAGGADSVLTNIDDIFDRGLSSIEERFAEAVVEVVDATTEALKLIQADADNFAAGLADRNFREGLSPQALAEYELQSWYDNQLSMINSFVDAGADFAGGVDSVLGNLQDIFDRGLSAIEDRFAVTVVEVVDQAAEALRLIQIDADSFAAGLADRNLREGLSPEALARHELQEWYDGQLNMLSEFVGAGAQFANGVDSVLGNIQGIFDRGLNAIEDRFAVAVVEVVDEAAAALRLLQADADSFASSLADRNFREGLAPEELARYELQQWYDEQLAVVDELLAGGAAFAGGVDSVLGSIQGIFDRGLTAIEERFATGIDVVVDQAGDAQQELARIASERYGLETRLLQLQGDAEQLRERELAQYHESNRSILEQVYALEDLQQAANDAALAEEQAADRLKSIAEQRESLQVELWTLQGRNDKVHALERSRYYETNRALFDHVEAMKAQKEAAEEAAVASRGVIDEILRLRGQSADGAISAGALNSRFSELAAQARRGDLEALAQLPELSRAIEASTLESASSLQAVQRTNAWLANTMAQALEVQNIAVPQFGAQAPLPVATFHAPSPQVLPQGAVPAQHDLGRIENELKAIKEVLRSGGVENEELMLSLIRHLVSLLQIVEKWDDEGTPPEAAA
ncbi:DUF4214 domain-containing protein [Pseudomaricurvus alkylphenolicus]|uniref:DUF4214 domain-containing protein n=1 Tax=Pseudomaricurvus alkylphenolicus TaxID=1306991 RepID=UPI001421860B|nr:DUF4214 domain-containing protein [Pseudomaricurvus alkylphenolicus]NIB44811.1 DUF4214 domain-containing protein [Pseudomaricurvus alkylphenolicus]